MRLTPCKVHGKQFWPWNKPEIVEHAKGTHDVVCPLCLQAFLDERKAVSDKSAYDAASRWNQNQATI